MDEFFKFSAVYILLYADYFTAYCPVFFCELDDNIFLEKISRLLSAIKNFLMKKCKRACIFLKTCLCPLAFDKPTLNKGYRYYHKKKRKNRSLEIMIGA